ncbi:hypothetical protein FIS3754_24220 [Fischerella sp. NIES-3754]|nr:hypothetical protein FIS3754_24220 [Fischerella sp. NIES-3754]BCX08800.1 MAG: hypothetical protein KatS3mg066_2659 [Fischerella sp.]
MVGVFLPPRHKGTKKLNDYVVNHTTRRGNIELDLYILSSCEDISQEQANRIIARMEAARDDVLQRVERIQVLKNSYYPTKACLCRLFGFSEYRVEKFYLERKPPLRRCLCLATALRFSFSNGVSK